MVELLESGLALSFALFLALSLAPVLVLSPALSLLQFGVEIVVKTVLSVVLLHCLHKVNNCN